MPMNRKHVGPMRVRDSESDERLRSALEPLSAVRLGRCLCSECGQAESERTRVDGDEGRGDWRNDATGFVK
jgi:hypothetical protein